MANSTVSPSSDITRLLEDYGSLFYIMDPRKTVFNTVEEVPNYIQRAYPFFILHIIIESIVVYMAAVRETHHHHTDQPKIHKKPFRAPRLNDAIGSISAGMTQQITKAFTKGMEITAYIFVFENLRIVDVDPNNPWVWLFAYLGTSIEIQYFNEQFAVHHSSEEYNQTTALRQSAFQSYISWAYYLPLALVLPPPLFVVHSNFNTLYQFWIHTETIPKLGFLEYIMNTPSAHRVHHGRNPYWIFGTYQEELDTEPVLFGLTHNIHSFNPIWIQVHHFSHIFKTVYNTPGVMHKLAVLFAGPGWSPLKPDLRFGDFNDIPSVPNLAENPGADIGLYNPDVALFQKSGKTMAALSGIYVLIQFIISLICQMTFMHFQANLSILPKSVAAAYVIFSLWVLGLFLDGKNASLVMEVIRLGAVSPIVAMFLVKTSGDPFQGVFGGLVGIGSSYAAASLVVLLGMYAFDRTVRASVVKAKTD
ncbi:hypothetical protein BC829DRAFT_389715 [Chytridium lagenaria]|nr:hypothetical protein BC829DRAFT_389715 [Chytridium lagenaria]